MWPALDSSVRLSNVPHAAPGRPCSANCFRRSEPLFELGETTNERSGCPNRQQVGRTRHPARSNRVVPIRTVSLPSLTKQSETSCPYWHNSASTSRRQRNQQTKTAPCVLDAALKRGSSGVVPNTSRRSKNVTSSDRRIALCTFILGSTLNLKPSTTPRAAREPFLFFRNCYRTTCMERLRHEVATPQGTEQ